MNMRLSSKQPLNAKRNILRIIALYAAMTLTSCGGSGTSTSSSPANSSTAQAPANGSISAPTSAPTAGATTNTLINYQAGNEDFPNPERGFAYENDVAWAPKVTWDYCGQGNNYIAYDYTAWNDPLKLTFLQEERKLGRSLVMSRYHIADFRNRDLTAEYLAFLQRDFDTVREAGVKMVLRFAYNYPLGGPDASLNRIKRHLDQLQPLLRQNSDVIAFAEAGFVGCWGEWHHSSNGLVVDEGGISEGQKQILDKWLEVLPQERMVAMRYPFHKFGYLGSADFKPVSPLTAETAYKGNTRSRIAIHDDCPVCSESHGSGYWNPRGDLNEAANFLKQENLFMVQGGEPGDPESIDPKQPANPNSPLSACPRVLEEFKNTHWSVMGLFNLNSPASAIKRWERDGCLEEIKQRMGYRYRITSAEIPQSAQLSNTLALKLEMTNDGWANLYNPRKLEIILRAKTSGAIYTLTVFEDARLKMPNPAETKTLMLSGALPKDLPAGTYELLLNLPDPTASLYARPEYSIRLANKDVWEPLTGFNKLLAQIDIKP